MWSPTVAKPRASSFKTCVKPCAHCGQDFTALSSFKGVYCSYDCKALAARKRYGIDDRAALPKPIPAKKRVRRWKDAEEHPVSVAYGSGDQKAIAAAIRSICIETPKGCWIPMPGYSHDDHSNCVPTGYQSVYLNGRLRPLHRLSCEVHRGVSLGNVQCHHTCAVRACCNPDHLQPATLINNVLEMRERTAFKKRIADLERALKKLDSDHPLLWPDQWAESSSHPLTLF